MAQEKEVEKEYANRDVIAKLRRLADALEANKSFAIQIAGERIRIPPTAKIEFEYSCEGDEAEVEIEFSWKKR